MDYRSHIPAILVAPLDLLDAFAHVMIADKLPDDYLATLAEKEKTPALRACLAVFIITRFMIVPRGFQLQASLTILNGRDSIIMAGTGSGKTFHQSWMYGADTTWLGSPPEIDVVLDVGRECPCGVDSP